MKRWDREQMLDVGKKLFAKTHKQKYHAHHNHEIHFMAREIEDWLPRGIQSITNGSYEPRCLKRYYFSDEMVDQLHLSDRIFQHILLKQLKPTFKHVMNPNVHAFLDSSVHYFRFQEDVLILCKTKTQLNRAWRKMLDIFNERRLSLSHKKTRRGEISSGFHFLGVCYAPTQPESNTTVMPVNDAVMVPIQADQNLGYGGG